MSEDLNAIELIAAERQRQIEKEGWAPEHDDNDYGLAMAAACYATPQHYRLYYGSVEGVVQPIPPLNWPWDDEGWKPTPDNRIRELVKAGALIVAEIERLERAE